MRGTEKMMLLCKIIFRQLNIPPSERYDREDFARPANEREYVGETLGQERYGEAAKEIVLAQYGIVACFRNRKKLCSDMAIVCGNKLVRRVKRIRRRV